MLAAVVGVLCITGLIVIILVNRIVNAMGKSMGLLQEIADGNLTVHVDTALLKRPDEVGMLGKEILQMRDKLRAIVNVLRDKSTQLDFASTTLKTHSNKMLQLMKGLDQTAQEMSISCTSLADDAGVAGSSVTEMGEMIGASNLEVQKMHEISTQIQGMSDETMSEILELNADMKKVRTSIDFLSKQTLLTKESADKISSATDLIAAVASQTRLLSLNASIEAARAGELGNGFGVVASEIQNLSVQANEAVEDIRTMVESLEDNSSHTIRRMEEVQAVIDNQESNITKTSQVFENVRNGILESVTHMDTILARAGSMEDTRTDMVAAVQNSAAMAQENAASIEEMMSTFQSAYEEIQILSDKTDELSGLSLQMKESVNVFSVQNA